VFYSIGHNFCKAAQSLGRLFVLCLYYARNNMDLSQQYARKFVVCYLGGSDRQLAGKKRINLEARLTSR